MTNDAYDDYANAEPVLWPALWRHRWLIAATTVVLALVGYVFSSNQAKVYTATAALLVADPSAPGLLEQGVAADGRYIANQVEYIESSVVVVRAAEDLNVSPLTVSASVSASASVDADVVTVTSTRPTAQEAASFANAVAAAYEDLRAEALQESTLIAVTDLEAEIASVESRIDVLSVALVEASQLATETELGSALEQLSDLRGQISQIAVETELFGSGVQFIERAVEPPEPSSPDVYTATSELLLVVPSASSEETTSGDSQYDSRYVANQARYLESTEVAARAAQALGVSELDVSSSVSASASEGADVVTITSQRPTAQEAASFANTVAAAYEDLQIENLKQKAIDATTNLQAEVSSVRTRIDELSAVLNSSAVLAAQVEFDAALARLTNLQAQLDQIDLGAERFGSGVQFLEQAREPSGPSAPQPLRTGILAAAIGLLLASAGAWWRHTRLPLVDARHDAAVVLDAPFLGEVPVFGSSIGEPHLAEADSQAAAAYGLILTAVGFAMEGIAAPTLVISSARTGDGKTLTALNLAAAAQADGRKPLLIDADQRARGLTKLVGAGEHAGLSDLTPSSDVDLIDVLREVVVGETTLSMLTAGAPPSNIPGFFRTPGFRKLMADIQGRSELTIIDTPSLLAVAETVNIAAQSDGVIVVVDRGTPLQTLTDLKERADLSNIRLVGYVFNRAQSSSRFRFGQYGRNATTA